MRKLSMCIVFVFLSFNAYSDPASTDLSQTFKTSDIQEKIQMLHESKTENIDLSGALDFLWQVFLEYPNAEVRAQSILALGDLGQGNHALIENLNNYIIELNQRFSEGEPVDYALLSACIAAIIKLGDSSSYPVLFSIIISGYPEVIRSEASGALEVIAGNLHQFLLNVIKTYPPGDKFEAFRFVISSEKLTVSERGQLAEAALAQALLVPPEEEDADLAAMRYAAVRILTELRWARASPLAVTHFFRVQTDVQQGRTSRDRLIEAIACLGAVGDSRAALILGLQLDLINLKMKNSRTFDPELTLAIVQALGLIGDNAVFEKLQTVRNLPYTSNIIAAAQEAITRLRW